MRRAPRMLPLLGLVAAGCIDSSGGLDAGDGSVGPTDGSVLDAISDAGNAPDAPADATEPDAMPMADAMAPDAPPPPVPPSMTVFPAARTLMLGEGRQFKAIGNYATGDVDITLFVDWSPADAAIATADPSGIVTGVGVGRTTVTAEYGGVTGEARVTVGRAGSERYPARNCREVAGTLSAHGDGRYWIDPTGSDPFEMYCDMTTDGGGWMLVSWANTARRGSLPGLPYPGHAPCPDLSCPRGSSLKPERMGALLQTGTEFAKAQQTDTVETFMPIHEYVAAGKYTYGPLTPLELNYGFNTCDTELPFAVGTFQSLNGPMPQDGFTVYLAHHLGANSLAPEDYSDASSRYYWSVGTLFGPCDLCINCPVSTLLGTRSPRQAGPLEWREGAHSVWVR